MQQSRIMDDSVVNANDAKRIEYDILNTKWIGNDFLNEIQESPSLKESPSCSFDSKPAVRIGDESVQIDNHFFRRVMIT